jgi:hypothetical protein
VTLAVLPTVGSADPAIAGLLASPPSSSQDSVAGLYLGGPAMSRIARDYGYTLDELRKL